MSRHARTSGGALDYDALFVVVPWSFTAAIVVGLPLMAALAAGLVTRARPMTARRPA
ncbi:hypothetical protein ACTMTF_29665 [Nonomuraea sp. ZG12]|uniref:hypothetical protein n=1 Tax=Nonomuraea sp. ZG12 TaxID=3452207 RepID=UPI003F8A51D3